MKIFFLGICVKFLLANFLLEDFFIQRTNKLILIRNVFILKDKKGKQKLIVMKVLPNSVCHMKNAFYLQTAHLNLGNTVPNCLTYPNIFTV